jgi:hypothetical protein
VWFKKRKRKKICKTVDIESFKVHIFFIFFVFIFVIFDLFCSGGGVAHMVRRVPTTDVLIKRVIFVGRAVDSHSTGTGKKSPAPKRNYVLTSTAYIEIDTVSTKKQTNGLWLISYLQSHLHTRQ